MRKDAESPPSKLGIVMGWRVAPVTQRDHPNSSCLLSRRTLWGYPRYSPSAMRTAKSAASASAAAGAAAVGAPRAS